MFHNSPRQWWQPLTAATAVAAVLLAGCSTPTKKQEEEERTVIADANDEADVEAEAADADGDADDDDVASSTQAMADRLSEALTRGVDLPEGGGDLSDEQWEQIRANRAAREAEAARQAQEREQDQEHAEDVAGEGEAHGPSSDETVADIDEAPEPMTRRALLAELRERLRESEDSAMSKALIAAAVSLADPNHEIDPAALAQLDAAERDRVELFQQVLLSLGQELAQGGELERATVERRLDELFRDQPLAIRTFALCRRVSGYGVYEPFEDHTFLAGQDQRIIAYSELDHFRHERQSNGRYEVKLEQEVVLYNESDGLAVWRHEPVQITDESRNERRDFFVVQMVTLPARLSVGKYRLKVRIADVHGGSMDETSIPIELVADASLVRERD